MPQTPDENTPGKDKDEGEKPLDRYFVVKSLTVEDLDLSVRNGIWATQAHNEAILNKAFAVSTLCTNISVMIDTVDDRNPRTFI